MIYCHHMRAIGCSLIALTEIRDLNSLSHAITYITQFRNIGKDYVNYAKGCGETNGSDNDRIQVLSRKRT